MLRTLVVLPLAFFSFILFGQTGPGGVGSSTNNVLWLDANKGTVLNGSNVSSWTDQSGNNNHANPPTPDARPSFVANSTNGYPSVDFDGVNDQLWVSDNNSIDLTQWHIFIVVTADLLKNYNAFMVKGDDVLENYELLSYSNGNIHTPMAFTTGPRTGQTSGGGIISTTEYCIMEYSYSNLVGRDIYRNSALLITDNENRTPAANNNVLYIGNEGNSVGRFLNGDLSETIIYNASLNAVQRIMVNNYLAAKFGLVLGANDLYVQDNGPNGNYDHDVAGIGQIAAGQNQTDSRGTGILRIFNAADLNDNEFFIWGHDNQLAQALNLTDIPTGVEGRFNRVWRASEVNASGTPVDLGALDLEFDLSGLGPITASELRLLIDLNNNGIFTDDAPVSGAVSAGGNLYRFQGITQLADGLRFTLGTTNKMATPLPVELLGFDVEKTSDRKVLTHWEVNAEEDLDYYRIDRALDFNSWELVGTVQGQELSNYQLIDHEPLAGISYYRLTSVDNNGATAELGIRTVEFETELPELYVFPNPADDQIVVTLSKADFNQFQIINQLGQDITGSLEMQWISDDQLLVKTTELARGVYLLTNGYVTTRLVVFN